MCRDLAALYKGLQPAQNSLPPFTVACGIREIAGESFLSNPHQRSGAGFFRTAGM
jgi:hypothetical protein